MNQVDPVKLAKLRSLALACFDNDETAMMMINAVILVLLRKKLVPCLL